jgi:peptidoglycan/xylan/chitin deacetylase (PgdA/CDA1 family)
MMLLRRWVAPLLTVVLLPVVCVGGTPSAGAVVAGCPSAPYGVASTAPGAGRTVALTFDDGPGHDTGRIMALLAAAHVTATFFNLGANEAGAPAVVRAERAGGYALGDHTWDHPSMPSLGAAGQAAEMDRQRAVEASITGRYPCVFRPPYGEYDATTLNLANARHMRVWNWSVDTEDWKAAGSGDAYWINRITSRAEAGASQAHPVILMHNQPAGNPATVAALPHIISYYRARGYTFVDVLGNTGPPTVRTVSPSSGRTSGGSRVTLTGSGFRGITAVTFGGVPGTALHVISSMKLAVTSPRHVHGLVGIRVITNHGTSPSHTADQYRYVSPPAISSISPTSGRTGGGTRVRINGADFRHVTVVLFGSTRGTALHVGTTRTLDITAPAHTGGIVGIRVVTRYGRSAGRTGDHYTYVAPPTITSITPAGGQASGGTRLRIDGQQFRHVTAVLFGSTPGTAVYVASTSVLDVTVPAHAAGTVDIQVVTSYGRSAARPEDVYTYADPVTADAVYQRYHRADSPLRTTNPISHRTSTTAATIHNA